MSQIAVVLTELELEAVASVREWVVAAHSGQMRRGGMEPYHQHVWRVGAAVQARRGAGLHLCRTHRKRHNAEESGCGRIHRIHTIGCQDCRTLWC